MAVRKLCARQSRREPPADFGRDPVSDHRDRTRGTPADERPHGLDRRTLLKRAGVIAGAAWVAPTIVDSLTSPAAAGTPVCSATFATSTTPGGPYTLTVPANCKVTYSIRGGGGGGGANGVVNGAAGGNATTLGGFIPAQTAAYTLTYYVGGPGIGATGTSGVGSGGAGYGTGGNGGDWGRPERGTRVAAEVVRRP